jgi:hypothetical protein
MPATAEQIHDILAEHLPYEVQMLNFSFEVLCWTPGILGQLPVNALIESFCIHARNLIDFFTEQSVSPKNYAGAKHYVGASWIASGDSDYKSDSIYGKLNEQIAHLTYGRQKDLDKKIQGPDIGSLKQVLDDEAKRFVDSLPPPQRAVWNVAAIKMGLYH